MDGQKPWKHQENVGTKFIKYKQKERYTQITVVCKYGFEEINLAVKKHFKQMKQRISKGQLSTAPLYDCAYAC